jgi:hypothetical protein
MELCFSVLPHVRAEKYCLCCGIFIISIILHRERFLVHLKCVITDSFYIIFFVYMAVSLINMEYRVVFLFNRCK